MTITQHISIDLQQPGNAPMVHAVQGDEYTRVVEIDLYSGGVAWNPPSNCECVIRYGKPDGKGGIYSVLPDNTPAYSIAGNAVTVTLAPQMVTVPGVVEVQVSIIKDRKDRLSTFSFAVDVEADPSKGELKSENYVNWKSYYIPQTTGATVGQYIMISKVDADGRIIEVVPVNAPSGGGTSGDNYLPKPATAIVGQVLRVSAVNNKGEVTGVVAVDAAIPTAVSQLQNDAGFISKDNMADALGYTPADAAKVFEAGQIAAFANALDAAGIEYGKIINVTDKTVGDTSANLCVTGLIPVKSGDVIRVNEDFPLVNTGSTSFILYDASKNPLQALMLSSIKTDSYYVSLVDSDSNGYITACKINKPGSVAFIRLCNNTTAIGANPVLTVNEEIRYEMGYGEKLNPKVKVDYTQILNAPQKNCWSILPHERLNIAYSAIGRKPVNTVAHFTDAAANFSYNVLKCDVRPTLDGELVCCHDAGFTFDGSGYITAYSAANSTPIRDVTAETVLGYRFKSGERPCLVGEYLEVCRKYGKVAFITIRDQFMDVVIPKLLTELRIHNMTYSTIINCMTYNSLVTWRSIDTDVMINYTLNAGVAIDKAQIDRAIGLGYCSLCGFGLTSSATTPNHTCDFDYARANGIRLLQAIAYKEGSPEDCYAMGYDGCQIGYAWQPITAVVDGYTKTETDNLIAAAIGGAIGGSY